MMVSDLFTFENVHQAYLDCRRGKRNSRSALEFEVRLEENLFGLCEELQNRTYQPGPSTCFITRRPKFREIFAAGFRDRIVHHLVVSRLEPIWEPSFIHDSYACRKGKGTHAAVHRLQQFFREATANGSRPAWYLHCDIRSYFLRIDKRILLEMLRKRLDRKRPEWWHQEFLSDMDWLLERVVMRDPAVDAIKLGDRALFDHVPQHKSLFHTGNRTGLPIGNYTSQFFANVYLDALDQFAKHTLKIRHYIRYVDDVVLVGESLEQLEEWERRMGAFLSERLGLEWNPRARKAAYVSNGCDFLGYIVYRDGLGIRRRTVAHCREKLAASEQVLVQRLPGGVTRYCFDEAELSSLQATLASYGAQFRHSSPDRIWSGIQRRFPFLRFYLRRSEPAWKRVVREPRRFRNLRQQYGWFARRFEGFLMFFRVGPFYEFYWGQKARAERLFEFARGRSRPGLGRGVGVPVRSGLAGGLGRVARVVPVAVVEAAVVSIWAGNVLRRTLRHVLLPDCA